MNIFENNPLIAKMQVGTVSGKPAIFARPAGIDPAKKGDLAMAFDFFEADNTLVWKSGKGLVSDACYKNCIALCEQAKAAGIKVVEA